jgi:hypothetical protein
MARKIAFVLLTMMFLLGLSVAQDKKIETRPAYKFVITISELDGGKRSNSRQYTVISRELEQAQLKTGNRLPIATGSFGGGVNPNPSMVNTQYQYIDTGVLMDLRFTERESTLDLDLNIEVSGVVQPDVQTESTRTNPVFRSAVQRTKPVITPGKPTVVTVLDDVSTKKQLEIEVLATKVR